MTRDTLSYSIRLPSQLTCVCDGVHVDLSRSLEGHRVTCVTHKSRLTGIADEPRGPELPERVATQGLGKVAARLLLPVSGRRGRGLRRHPVPEPLCLTVTVERVP